MVLRAVNVIFSHLFLPNCTSQMNATLTVFHFYATAANVVKWLNFMLMLFFIHVKCGGDVTAKIPVDQKIIKISRTYGRIEKNEGSIKYPRSLAHSPPPTPHRGKQKVPGRAHSPFRPLIHLSPRFRRSSRSASSVCVVLCFSSGAVLNNFLPHKYVFSCAHCVGYCFKAALV